MKNEFIVSILGLLLILTPRAYAQIEGARICPICSPSGGPYVFWDDCPHGRSANVRVPPDGPQPPKTRSVRSYEKEGEQLLSDVWEISRPLTLRLERLYICKAHYEKAIKDHPNHRAFQTNLKDINGYIQNHLKTIKNENDKIIQRRNELAAANARVTQLLGRIQSFAHKNERDAEFLKQIQKFGHKNSEGDDLAKRSFIGPDDTSRLPSAPADRLRSQFLVDLRPRDNDAPLVVDPLVVAGKMSAPQARAFRAKQAGKARQDYRTAFINGDLDKAIEHLRFAISQTPYDSKLRMEYTMANLLKEGKRVSGGPIGRVQVLLDALENNNNDWLKSCAYLRHLESRTPDKDVKRDVKEAFVFVAGAAVEIMAIDGYKDFPTFISPMLDLPDDEDVYLLLNPDSDVFDPPLADWLQADLDFEEEINQREFQEMMVILEKSNKLFYAQDDHYGAIEFMKRSLSKRWNASNEDLIRREIYLKEGVSFGKKYRRQTNRIKQYQSPPALP
jgi:polyhydroxyalkanoate synthesis regulator phasin